jgi:hypothetical protein
MDLKTMVRQDMEQVVFNPDELGQAIDLNGKNIIAIKDNIMMMQIGSKETPGLIAADLVLYVKEQDLESPLAPDMTISVDGQKYRVISVSGEMITQVALQKVVGRNAGTSKLSGRAGAAPEIGRFRQ